MEMQDGRKIKLRRAVFASCYDRLQSPASALSSLLQSFSLDSPRAEICCDIGRHFLHAEKYLQSIFWYELALTIPKKEQSGAFVSPDCYGYLPCIQLCVCYDRLGDYEKAREYNQRAGEYKPDSPAYLANLEYFASRS